MSTAIRDHFRGTPDEFVTGPLGSERAIQSYKESNPVTTSSKDQLESFISSLIKMISTMEKTSQFGHGKKEDISIITKELQNLGHLQSKSSFLSQHFAGSQDNLMKFSSEFAKVGLSWNEYAQEYEKAIIDPLKMLKVC